MTEHEANTIVEGLSALGHFPSSTIGRGFIAEELMSMCPTVKDGMWLVRLTIRHHRDWGKCGVVGLWQIWFSKHKPANAEQRALDRASGSTESYPDGIPSECEQLTSGERLALPAGVTETVDLEAEKTILDLAEAHTMPAPKVFRTISESEARVDAELRAIMHTAGE
jgi:hypothetical protein